MRYADLTEEQKERRRAAVRKWKAAHDRRKYYSEYDKDRNQYGQRRKYRMWYSAKERAAAAGLPFSIAETDIEIPELCPVCAEPMAVGYGKKGGTRVSPTLDKIRPSEGYVKGNIAVMCKGCNSTKGDASSFVLRRMADWIDRQTCG